MRPDIRIIFLVAALALLAAGSYSQEPIRPTQNITKFKTHIIWTDSNGVRAAKNKYALAHSGNNRPSIRTTSETGFTVMFRNRKTGEYACELYLIKPEYVDDEKTTATGHELEHCIFGRYHR